MFISSSTAHTLCVECGSQRIEINVPTEKHLLWLPFSGGHKEVIYRDWSSTELVCEFCTREKEDAKYSGAFQGGVERGYEKAKRELT